MPDHKTVMIADDEHSLRMLMRATLSQIDVRVLEAATGPEALDLARRERPDLVLLDIGMPGLDGWAVCQALKRDYDLATTRVVLITALAQQKDRERAFALGADAFITKPFSPSELLTNVQGLIS